MAGRTSCRPNSPRRMLPRATNGYDAFANCGKKVCQGGEAGRRYPRITKAPQNGLKRHWKSKVVVFECKHRSCANGLDAKFNGVCLSAEL